MSKELTSALKAATSRKKANKKSTRNSHWGLVSASMVSVVPLGAPTGTLMYMDPIYKEPTPEPDSIESVVNQIRIEIGLEIPKIPEKDWKDKEIDLHLTSIPVTVPARKIKATWDPSLTADLSHYSSIDAEEELTKLLAEEIIKELKKLNKKKSR